MKPKTQTMTNIKKLLILCTLQKTNYSLYIYNGKIKIYKRYYMRSIFKYLGTNDCVSVYKILVRCRETETIREQ